MNLLFVWEIEKKERKQEIKKTEKKISQLNSTRIRTRKWQRYIIKLIMREREERERERDCFYKINVDEIGTSLTVIWTVVNTCSKNWKIKLFCFLWFCSLNSHYIAHSIVIHVLILAIIFLQWQFVIYSCDELLCSNCIRKTSRDWQMKRDFDDFMFAYYVC